MTSVTPRKASTSSKTKIKATATTDSTMEPANQNITRDMEVTEVSRPRKRQREAAVAALNVIREVIPRLQDDDHKAVIAKLANTFAVMTDLLQTLVDTKDEPLVCPNCMSNSKANHQKQRQVTALPQPSQVNCSATTTTFAQVVAAGNKTQGKRPNVFNPLPHVTLTPQENVWKVVQPRKPIIGYRKDQIQIIENPTDLVETDLSMDSMENLPTEFCQRTPPVPQTHEVTVLRFNNTPPRHLKSAMQWREKVFLAHNIKTHSILHPTMTSLEVVANKEDHNKILALMKNLKYTAVDVNPYLRRDGRAEPLDDEILRKTCLQRIRMLQYERSIVGIRWLMTTITKGLTLLRPLSQSAVQNTLQTVLKERGLTKVVQVNP